MAYGVNASESGLKGLRGAGGIGKGLVSFLRHRKKNRFIRSLLFTSRT